MDHFDFQLLRAIRKDKGLSQERLARECNVSTPTIINLEMGRQNPSLVTLSAISRVLGIELSMCIKASYRKPPRFIDGMPGPYQPDPGKTFQMFEFQGAYSQYVEIPSGHEEDMVRFPFADIFVYMIEGEVDWLIDGKEYSSGPGEMLSFDGLSNRKIRAKNEIRCVGIAVPKKDSITSQIIQSGKSILNTSAHPLVTMAKAKQDINLDIDFTIIKILRNFRNVSLEKLSETSGISVPAISSIELNKRIPTLGTLNQLTQALDVDADEVITFACRRSLISIETRKFELPDEFRDFEIIESPINHLVFHYGKNVSQDTIELPGPVSPSKHVMMVPTRGDILMKLGRQEHLINKGRAIVFDSRHIRTYQFPQGLEGYTLFYQRPDFSVGKKEDEAAVC